MSFIFCRLPRKHGFSSGAETLHSTRLSRTQIYADKPNDIGVIFKINDVVQPINSFSLTNTNIPFPLHEIYSSDKSKWLKDMLPMYISAGANFYIDTSRQVIYKYLTQRNPELISKLQHVKYPYHGRHTDPENTNNCLGEADISGHCDDHWSRPEIIGKNRKIIIPWGKTVRRVIPFIVSEGQLYFVTQNHVEPPPKWNGVIVMQSK